MDAKNTSCLPCPLEGKRILVTGASRGIGRAIASLYASFKPASIYLVSRSKSILEKVAEDCRGQGAQKAVVLVCDLSDPRATSDLAEEVLKAEGGIDVLVNNAGAVVSGSAIDGNIEDFSGNLNMNLLAPIILTRKFAPSMKAAQNGAIINIGSVAAIEGMTNHGLYSATKFGLRGWSLHCYEKLRYDNIKVFCIHPGFVATEMVASSDSASRVMPERMIQPEDLAEVALLPFRTTAGCCPLEVTLRLTRTPYK